MLEATAAARARHKRAEMLCFCSGQMRGHFRRQLPKSSETTLFSGPATSSNSWTTTVATPGPERWSVEMPTERCRVSRASSDRCRLLVWLL
jgi:hypothetical protein